jgi:hypothetical protein
MGNVQGPEKVNDMYMKTMHVGTMDRGFTLSYKYMHYRQVRNYLDLFIMNLTAVINF